MEHWYFLLESGEGRWIFGPYSSYDSARAESDKHGGSEPILLDPNHVQEVLDMGLDKEHGNGHEPL